MRCRIWGSATITADSLQTGNAHFAPVFPLLICGASSSPETSLFPIESLLVHAS
jgi:hypothetical protein